MESSIRIHKKKTGQWYNYIKDQQYPFGFKSWLREVAKVLQKDHGCFKEVFLPTAVLENIVDPDAWLVYFMDGYDPRYAVYEDLRNI